MSKAEMKYNLAEWLVKQANRLRSSSPVDGYEWLDYRSSNWASMGMHAKLNSIGRTLDCDCDTAAGTHHKGHEALSDRFTKAEEPKP